MSYRPLGMCLLLLVVATGAVYLVARTASGLRPVLTNEHDELSFRAEFGRLGDLDGDNDHRFAAAAPGLPDPKLYPPVDLSKIAAKDGWARPRCLVRGRVILVKHEDDGDYHFAIEGNGSRVVCEIVPELPLEKPHVGQRVTVWGIPRWDGEHRWGEIHPVIGWKEN